MSFTRSLALITVTTIVLAPGIHGQDNGIRIRIAVTQNSYDALSGVPFMVSLIQEGAVVQQAEQTYNNGLTFRLGPGIYEVRLEGAGAVTEVKRGITVTDGNWTDLIGGPMRAGEGLRIVEYATGGFTREEMAARIASLEAALSRVQEALDRLTAAHERAEPPGT